MAHLLPEDLAVLATRQTLPDFLNAYGGTAFLLVKLDDPSGELAAGLFALRSAQVARVQPNLQVLAFHTVIATLPAALSAGRKPDTGEAELRQRIAQTAHYAITLDKRVHDGTYTDRISIGRARNKDIVLRHPSVSKFHAWVERDEAGGFYVADAGSKNGTRVHQEPCAARALTLLASGDVLRFGSVEAVVCDPQALWRALQTR